MAKKKKSMSEKEFKLLAGIVLILIALIGVSQVLTILLVLIGAWLVYEALRK